MRNQTTVYESLIPQFCGMLLMSFRGFHVPTEVLFYPFAILTIAIFYGIMLERKLRKDYSDSDHNDTGGSDGGNPVTQ